MERERIGSVARIVLVTLAGLSCISSGCSRAVPSNAKGATASRDTAAHDMGPRLQSEGPLPGYALVYAEKQGKEADPRTSTLYNLSWDVIWLPGAGGGPARTVYVGGPKMWFNGRLPVYLGFLPSPDGHSLCVWETQYGPEGRWDEPLKTVWTVVELPEGRARPIHMQQGLVGYLPVWLDNYRLRLEKGDLSATFDVRTDKLSQELPANTPPRRHEAHDRDVDDDTQSAMAWRGEYLAQHFPGDPQVLGEALRTLPTELGLSDYLRERGFPRPDTQDDLLLRAMGVVGLWGPWVRFDKRVWPSVAISPNHRLIARAAVLRTDEVFQLSRWWSTEAGPKTGNAFNAQVDVYEVSSRRHLWGISVPRPSTTPADVSVSDHECWFSDIRWSQDGRYLSFTWHQYPHEWVSVVDASSWCEVLRVSNASNAFVAPYVAEAGR